MHSNLQNFTDRQSAAICLAPFAKHVRGTRARFLRSLRYLPRTIRARARAHIYQRLGPAVRHPLPLIGEYAPWLAADLLGIKDVRSVRQVAVAWLHLYFFTLALDDVIDSNTTARQGSEYITSCLLLQRGLSNLISLSKGSKKLTSSIDSAFSRTAEAAIHELATHRNRISRYSATEINALGRKIGLLTICPAAVGGLRKICCEDLKEVDRAFEKLATGIQLLDDLTDWRDDFDVGNLTVPITLSALRQRNKSYKRQYKQATRLQEQDAVMFSMIQTKAIEDTLAFAIAALRKALSFVNAVTNRNGNGLLTRNYVAQLITDAEYAMSVITECRIQVGEVLRKRPHLSCSEITQHLMRVRRALYVVAQKS